jgi:hypothetical protein
MFSNCSVLIKTNKEVFDAVASIVPVALLLQSDMVPQEMTWPNIWKIVLLEDIVN